jgi:hypothetical protein
MRKFLLASAAVVGAVSWLTPANAQPTAMVMMPTQGMVAGTPSASPPAGANNNNNTNVIAAPGAVANPTPGTVVIHVNGRVTTDLSAYWSSLDRVNGSKLQPVNLSTYARIYTGLDAMAANGLRYGGAIEVRENFTAAAASNSSTGGSGYSSTETLFFRRAFGYIAADNVGMVRIGQGDGLISLYDNGVASFQFLPSGNLNGGDLQSFVGNTVPPFAFQAVSGAEYTTMKIVYLSPQFAGFDFGVSWAPNPSGNGFAPCATAGSGCPTQSSSIIAADSARLLNLVQAGVRYQAKFDALGVLAYGIYSFSGHTSFAGPHTVANQTYQGVHYGNAGVALTFAGFTVGGAWTGGSENGQGAPVPDGGSGMNAWTAGVTYKTGPLTVGAVFESIDSQGSPLLSGRTQRHEYAADVGASYTIAPGMVAWAEYLYQARKQSGFNFNTGAVGAAFNSTSGQGLQVGTTFYW